jgi:hypothetical protein
MTREIEETEESCETKTVCQVFGCGGCGLAPDADEDEEFEGD